MSKIPEVLNAIVDGLDAVLPEPLYDGPVVSGDYANSYVFIGYSGEEGSYASATADQDWAGIGAGKKNEEISVPCAAVYRGTESIRANRTGVYELLGRIEAHLRSNKAMGLPAPSLFAFSEGTLHQEPSPTGLQARVTFTITAKVRI